MGLLDRWLGKVKRQRAAHIALDEEVQEKIFADGAIADVSHEEKRAQQQDPLDKIIVDARHKLTLDEAGRRYAASVTFQADLRALDAGGRPRAADALLTDALLVSPDLTLRKALAERLLYRGDREQAKTLLTQLREHDDYALFANLSLGEIYEHGGDLDRARAAYERVLAVDVCQRAAKTRARRLRDEKSGWGERGEKDRAALTRFLGTRAAGSRYSVMEELGRGGAATVFRARDRVASREVALKIFHPRGHKDERRARIREEARIAGGFDHPHIVPILDVDPERDLLVMSLCDSGSLRDRLRDGRLHTAEMAEIGTVLLRTLADIHAQGGVHLDVKPSNLLFHQGAPMLCDFGTAGLTKMGAAGGTRAYMAPEQRTRGATIAPSDIYATALLLVESATGSLPTTGTVRLNALLPGPRRRALEDLFSRMLSTDPSDRPNASEAAADLQLFSALPKTDAEGRKLLEHVVELGGEGVRDHALVRLLLAPSGGSPL